MIELHWTGFPRCRQWNIHGHFSLRMHVALLVIGLAVLCAGCSRSRVEPVSADGPLASDPALIGQDELVAGSMPLFHAINDPIERVNRGMDGFNVTFFRWLIYPLNRGYRILFPEFIRKRISKIGYNLAFPKRLVNTASQGKFRGTLDETNRFLINTTIGIAGIFDPATKWGIETHREDFGQTFGYWGSEPGFYFNLPFLGPSSGRDALGALFDLPFDLAFAYRLFFKFNELSFFSDQFLTLLDSQEDPYSLIRDGWALDREKDVLDFEIENMEGDPDETLGAIFLTPQNPRFWFKGETRKIKVPWTGRKFPYTFWPQKGESAILIILPGLGSHRSTSSSVALAEMAHRNGFTPVVVSSTMHAEFMTRAGSGPFPGYVPQDCQDLARILALIHEDIHKRYPGRFSHASLMGLSMGAFQTLYLAAMEIRGELGDLEFARYLAINAPRSLAYGLGRLDDFYNAPLNWNSTIRGKKIRETIFKALTLGRGELSASSQLPITRFESEFLIGLNFRLILKNMIYVSQQAENSGILQCDTGSFRREPCYDEIREYGFKDYAIHFAMPWFISDPEYPETREQLLERMDLQFIENELRSNDRIRLHINENDFLLRSRDIEWMEDVFEERLIRFPGGGHLGNLHIPEVQDRILESLSY
jgi:ABC-type transporter lipoprotein component MlaA